MCTNLAVLFYGRFWLTKFGNDYSAPNFFGVFFADTYSAANLAIGSR